MLFLLPALSHRLISLSSNMVYSSIFQYGVVLEHIMWNISNKTKDFEQAVGEVDVSFYNLRLILNTKDGVLKGAVIYSLRLKMDRLAL